MTKEKYKNCSVEELLEDEVFISKIISIETNEEWEQFLNLHKESKRKIIKARKIIHLFRVNSRTLSDEKKFNLWKKISSFNEEVLRSQKVAKIGNLVKVAASVLVIISLGTLLYQIIGSDDKQYEFSQSQNELRKEAPLLLLSSGEEIPLGKNESKITVLKDQGAIQINNDTVVKNLFTSDYKSDEIKYNEVIIPYGKNSKIILGDGTKVWLNAGSRFAFPQKFSGEKREVFLEGEGYFIVAKNKKQPFLVNTKDVNIEVLGTRFNVCAYSSDSFNETVLLEGSVNIWEKGSLFNDKIRMSPNQKATFSKDQSNIMLQSESQAGTYIAWVEGWYQFTNESLDRVLNKLSRYYNVTFNYDQALISEALPISGKLDLKDSLNEVLTVLSKVAKIEYRLSGENVIIYK